MTSKELADLASNCGARYELGSGDEPTTGGMMFWDEGHISHDYPTLVRFAEAIAAKEREACADIADEAERHGWTGAIIADAIRMRANA